jgi:hypothetical protein
MLSRKGERKGRATAALEFALVLPLLLILGIGVCELGFALYHHHVINKGVRDAARFLAHVKVSCPGGVGAGSVDDPAQITRAKNLAQTGYATSGSPIISYWTDPGTITVRVRCVDNTSGALNGPSAIPIILVSASVPYQDIGLVRLLGLDPIVLNAEHEEVHVGD